MKFHNLYAASKQLFMALLIVGSGMANPEGTDLTDPKVAAKSANHYADEAAQWSKPDADSNKVQSAFENGAALVEYFADKEHDASDFGRLEKETMNLLLTGSKEQLKKFAAPALRIAALVSTSNHYDDLNERAPLFGTEINYHVLRAPLPTSWTPEGVRPPALSPYAQLIMTLSAWDFSKAKMQFFENSKSTEDEQIVFLMGLEKYAKKLPPAQSLEMAKFLESERTTHSNKEMKTYIQNRVLPAVLARAKSLHKENPTILKQLSEMNTNHIKGED